MVEHVSDKIVGTSAHSYAIRQFIGKVAKSRGSVILLGEPGVGKELIARSLHLESPRRQQPFLMIDCSLYYERELKREVFGYSGAGSGAKSRKGLLEFASQGTCYLSHIEELTPALQDDLLAFLRTGRFRRLGDGRELTSRVRVIVSTDKNIGGFVEGGLFNRELYRELHRLPLTILPLRQRAEDAEALVAALAEDHRRRQGLPSGRKFSAECLEALKCFPWPRNFDELRKEVQRLLNSGIETVRPEDLSFEISSYWLGQRADPEVRRVVEELDGYIREFKVLSRLDAEFGDLLLKVNGWGLEMETEMETR